MFASGCDRPLNPLLHQAYLSLATSHLTGNALQLLQGLPAELVNTLQYAWEHELRRRKRLLGQQARGDSLVRAKMFSVKERELGGGGWPLGRDPNSSPLEGNSDVTDLHPPSWCYDEDVPASVLREAHGEICRTLSSMGVTGAQPERYVKVAGGFMVEVDITLQVIYITYWLSPPAVAKFSPRLLCCCCFTPLCLG